MIAASQLAGMAAPALTDVLSILQYVQASYLT
jgi:hypothetical protein